MSTQAPKLADSEVGSLVASLRDVSRAFDDTKVLFDIDLDIQRGEFVALLGRSGTGKSTLLRIVTGLDKGATGSITVTDRVSVGFQEPRLLPWKKVWRNIVLGLTGPDLRGRANRTLHEVGLDHRADVWPLTLSGGEAQRASLARALIREPQLMVLDEPFGALDALTKIKMHALLLDLFQKHRPGVLLVTHDVEEAILLADRVLVMDVGRFVSDTQIDLPHPRTKAGDRFVELRTKLLADLGVTDVA
ncbi:ABC transporter ATP-binding protein [Microbacterium sp. LWH7-1.2]|jgi:sulfonate transport system ATP-binding protein|uniref:ABC transporter ATP-binding protein n=1 Tax=Microbacterium sp. LWH7-1.2 TaxID=3135257 RepID=UPI003139AFDC